MVCFLLTLAGDRLDVQGVFILSVTDHPAALLTLPRLMQHGRVLRLGSEAASRCGAAGAQLTWS